jgi:hypothetical protein
MPAVDERRTNLPWPNSPLALMMYLLYDFIGHNITTVKSACFLGALLHESRGSGIDLVHGTKCASNIVTRPACTGGATLL